MTNFNNRVVLHMYFKCFKPEDNKKDKDKKQYKHLKLMFVVL